MGWWEIFKEVATKGLRTMNDEINAGVSFVQAANDTGDGENDPLRHTRDGYKHLHPAFYDPPRNDRGVA